MTDGTRTTGLPRSKQPTEQEAEEQAARDTVRGTRPLTEQPKVQDDPPGSTEAQGQAAMSDGNAARAIDLANEGRIMPQVGATTRTDVIVQKTSPDEELGNKGAVSAAKDQVKQEQAAAAKATKP